MEEKAVAVRDSADVWTAEQVQTIKNTVAVGANDSELKMFLTIAAKYDLDPFLREIWCVNMGNRITITTGRDGYLKIAHRNPNFDGLVSDVVHAGDRFIKEGDKVNHAYNMQNRGPIVGAYAIVYRKDRTHPAYVFAPFNEYNKGGRGVWGQYPSAMIQKVAESMALKRAFSISGLVTEEEIGDGEVTRESTAQQNAEDTRKKIICNIWNAFVKLHGSNDARLIMSEITGKNSSSEYTENDIKLLAEYLKNHAQVSETKQTETETKQSETQSEPDTAIDVEEIITDTEKDNAESQATR